MTDLQKEAEEYFLNTYSWTGINNLPYKEADVKNIKQDFIAGANSNFIKQQILQGKIDVLNEIIDDLEDLKHEDNEFYYENNTKENIEKQSNIHLGIILSENKIRKNLLLFEVQLKELQNDRSGY